MRRAHFVALALLYALGVIYSSLILGPAGLHYVPISLGEAWHKFTAIHYANTGSDQRPDWIANLMMTIPLAFLVNAALYGAGGGVRTWIAAVLSFAICLVFILAVKYTQLFFPPRTVTLNYITAQVIGAALGVAAFRVSKTISFYPRLVRRFENGDGLTILLGAYTLWIVAYYLMPFDFTLSLGDLALRGFMLPDMLLAFPGEGRPLYMRFLLVFAGIVAAVPIGMFMAVRGRNRSTGRLLWRGFWWMVLVTVVSMFVLSATTYLLAIAYRTLGVYLGIRFIAKIHGKDLRKRHYYFARHVPMAFAIYVLAVALISDLFTSQWSTSNQALNALEPRQFLPFWNFYIVSKARASESIVAHIIVYAPIGVMVWLRRGFWARGATFSAALAFGLSMLMEIGRWLKPGLRPDFSDPIVAAIAAGVMFKAMPYLWKMFEREAAMGGSLDTYIAEMLSKEPQAPVAPAATDEAEPSAPVA
jgi:VanZ family protein